MSIYFILAWLWGILILILTLMPGSAIPVFSFSNLFQIDKLAHLVFFFVLSYLMIKSFAQKEQRSFFKINYILFSILISFLYGLTLEILQHFIPGRGLDPLDVLANTTGAILGGLIYLIQKKLKHSS